MTASGGYTDMYVKPLMAKTVKAVYTHTHNEILCEQLSLAIVTIYSYYVGQSYIISQLLKKADSFCYFNAFRLTNDLLM